MRQCHVYFIQEGDNGPIKIGYAHTDVASRMRSMQTSNSSDLRLLGTIPAKICDERRWHHAFAAERKRGEWFYPSPRLLSAIAEVLASPPIVIQVSEQCGDPFRNFEAWMDERRITYDALADLMGYSASTIRGVIRSKSWMGLGLAQAMESITDGRVRAEALIKAQSDHTKAAVKKRASERKTRGDVPASSWRRSA